LSEKKIGRISGEKTQGDSPDGMEGGQPLDTEKRRGGRVGDPKEKRNKVEKKKKECDSGREEEVGRGDLGEKGERSQNRGGGASKSAQERERASEKGVRTWEPSWKKKNGKKKKKAKRKEGGEGGTFC